MYILYAPFVLFLIGTGALLPRSPPTVADALHIVSGIAEIVYQFRAFAVDDRRYHPQLNLWAIIAFGSTFIFNLLVSSLLASRLWYVPPSHPASGNGGLMTIAGS